MLNDSGQINWANGVAPAAEIKKEHDVDVRKTQRWCESVILQVRDKAWDMEVGKR